MTDTYITIFAIIGLIYTVSFFAWLLFILLLKFPVIWNRFYIMWLQIQIFFLRVINWRRRKTNRIHPSLGNVGSLEYPNIDHRQENFD